jgi:hypothetical protein
MKSKFRRFEGLGNVMVGDERPAPAWQVTCGTCGATLAMPSHGANPGLTWARFSKAGWRLDPKGIDECPDCIERHKQQYRVQKQQRYEEARAHHIEQLSPAAMADDPSVSKARLAAAVLVAEILRQPRWELSETLDLIQLTMEFCKLDKTVAGWKPIWAQVKLAAFSVNLKDAAAARAEAKRLMARLAEAQEDAERRKADEALDDAPAGVASGAERFAEKFAPLLKPPAPPEPPPAPPVSNGKAEAEPSWLRNARARMARG